MDYKEFFKDKKVTQMGLGLLGRGVGDALFLAECGAEVLVTDLKSEDELRESVDKLKGVPGITFHLGGHQLEDFQTCDMVLKAAGVPLDSPFVAEAKKNNIPVEMGAALLCKLAPGGIVTVGITGTRGKSTTTHLVHHILKTAGKSTYLGGNVRDVATLPLLKNIQDGDCVVMELDSWQLQGFGDAQISPHIAVFTAFMHDHMIYYKNDLGQYFRDKANIYLFQKKNDAVIAGEDVASIIAGKEHGAGELIIAKREEVPKTWSIRIPGEHNLLNISCAIAAAKALSVDMTKIKEAVESFNGVEGRLQFVKETNGIKIYNDNNATTPEATVAGLKAVANGKNVILAMGGTDKGLDMQPLIDEIGKSCKTVVFFKESGTDKIKEKLRVLQGVEVIETETFEDSIKKGFALAKPGDIFLFSPAFASFGRFFKNEYDRNDKFLAITATL